MRNGRDGQGTWVRGVVGGRARVGGEVEGRGRGEGASAPRELVSTCGSVDVVSNVGGVFGVSWGLAGGNAVAADVAAEDECASGVVCDFVCLEERLAPVVCISISNGVCLLGDCVLCRVAPVGSMLLIFVSIQEGQQ